MVTPITPLLTTTINIGLTSVICLTKTDISAPVTDEDNNNTRPMNLNSFSPLHKFFPKFLFSFASELRSSKSLWVSSFVVISYKVCKYCSVAHSTFQLDKVLSIPWMFKAQNASHKFFLVGSKGSNINYTSVATECSICAENMCVTFLPHRGKKQEIRDKYFLIRSI